MSGREIADGKPWPCRRASICEDFEEPCEAKPAPVQSAGELDKYAIALNYILSVLAKNVWMGAKGEKECIRASDEFEENSIEHIKRYFNEIAAAQRQAGREEERAIVEELRHDDIAFIEERYAAVVEAKDIALKRIIYYAENKFEKSRIIRAAKGALSIKALHDLDEVRKG